MPELHPDQQQLRAYAIGQMTDEQVLELERHLETCLECGDTLDDLSVADATLLDGLRRPRPEDPLLQEPRLTLALARIATLADPPLQSDFAAHCEEPGNDLGSIGIYRLVAELGAGGMGRVYQALHTKLKRMVALKVLPTERLRDPHALSRFEREMEAVGRLDHPHIVRAIDAGEADGTHFLVMEFVAGWDLSAVSRQCGPLAIPDACELIRQAALGLQFAHERGLVHRDIKPGNLMLAVGHAAHSTESQLTSAASAGMDVAPTVKILDFGLARLSDLQDEGDGLTSTGQVMGTLDYMAPEQAGDSHGIDIRADIYSLGATLYKLLTGHSIFHDKHLQSTLQKLSALANQPAPPIQAQRADVPEELAAIIHRLLEKEPARRPATPAEVATALEPFATGAGLAALARRMRGDEQSPAVDRSSQSTHDSLKSASVNTDPHGVRLPISAATMAETVNLSQVPVGSQAMDAQSGRRRPRGRWMAIGWAGAAALLLATVFYFQTNHGTLVVEVDDPEGELSVAVEGQAVVISDKQKPGEAIRLRAGEHKLRVTRGDLAFDSDAFTIRRGDRVALSVKLVPGEIQIVRVGASPGDRPLGRARLPQDDVTISPPSMVADSRISKPTSEKSQVAEPSPWDALDPEAISEAERIPQLPPQTVAVFGSHRQRLWGRPTTIAIRPDGKQAAAAGDDGIRFWDLGTFQETAWLNPREHDVKGVVSLAYTSDGQWLLASENGRFTSIDCTAEIPNIVSRRPLAGMSLELSPSGEWLAGVGYQDRQGYLLRITEVSLIRVARFPELAEWAYSNSPIMFSPDGRRVCMSCRSDGTVQLYDFQDGELTAGPILTGSSDDRVDVPLAPLTVARFAPDGRLAVADAKRRIWFWDVSGNVPQPLFHLDRPAVTCRLSSDGKTLLTNINDSPFNVWSLGPDNATFRFSNAPTPPGSYSIPSDNLQAFALSADGQLAITGHLNGVVRFWDLRGGTLREYQPVAPNPLVAHVKLPSGIGMRTEGPESIWIGPSGTTLTSTPLTVAATSQTRRPLCVSPDQSRLVTGADGGEAIIHELRDGAWQPIRAITTGAKSVVSAAMNADHSRLAIGTDHPKAISLWDLTSPQPTRVAQFDSAVAEVWKVAFAADDKLLVARIGRSVSVFRVSDQSLEELPVPELNNLTELYDFDISPDGLELVTGGYHGTNRWSLSESGAQHVQKFSRADSVSYSPDGRMLAMVRRSGDGHTTELVIRNLQTGLDEQSIPFPGRVQKVLYLDDSRHIATANGNGTIYILRP